jgi:signal transduction histidine kinase
MKTNVRRRIAGLFAAAILLLGSLAGLRLVGYRNSSRLIESDRQIAHSQSILDALRDVYSTFQEAEGAQRGYLLSGDEQFLRAYRAAAEAIPHRIDSLAALIEADPHQSEQLRQMIPMLTAEERQLDEAIHQRRNAAAIDAQSQIENTARGTRSMAAIGQAIHRMQADEVVTMRRHAMTAYATSRRSLEWFLTLSIVDFALLAAGFVLLNRHMSRRQRAETRAARLNADLQRKNAELEVARGQMQQAKEAAEAANRAKDQFLATVSHELRSPLSAILLWAHAARLSARGSIDAELKEALDGIESAARTQSRLVEDLLDVSRIVHGRLRVEFEPLNLPDVVRASADMHVMSARAKAIDLSVDVRDDEIPIQGDPLRLRQVIGNLLSNAIKFTPAGGRVRVTAGRDGAEAYVRVEDTGRGIPPEFLPHVFDRFAQADPTVRRERTGLGLGLAIVQHIARLHGGDVAAHSDGPGRGATFTLTLPSGAPEPPSDPALGHDISGAAEATPEPHAEPALHAAETI